MALPTRTHLSDLRGASRLIVDASINPVDEPDAQRDEFGPVVTQEGDILWYSFRRPDRGGTFYRLGTGGDVEREDALPDPSAPTFVAYFTLSSDGATAVIEGRSASGRDSDLFYACRNGDAWSAPRPLDAVNSSFGDGGPYLTADGASLFFVSSRPTKDARAGDSNIYRMSTESLPIPCAQ